MNDDTISRSALKREFETTPYNDYDDLLRTERLIDNAPTVEPEVYPILNGKDYNLYLEGYKQGKKDFERPQGEWVRKEDIIHYIATQYSEHNELVPVWLNIGDLKGGVE